RPRRGGSACCLMPDAGPSSWPDCPGQPVAGTMPTIDSIDTAVAERPRARAAERARAACDIGESEGGGVVLIDPWAAPRAPLARPPRQGPHRVSTSPASRP